MSIIVSKNGKNARILGKSIIKSEAYLQEYIRNNPELIPIYELNEDKKLFIAKREFPTNAGPIDALAVDEIGDIYVVETKLFKNPDKRLVIAQVLDYGAALWKHYTEFDDFIEVLNCETEKLFNMSFQDKARDFFDLDDEQTESMFDTIQKNLDDGIIKFVILMDKIDERLKDLILYVNQNSQFDIFAVQIEYYKFEKYEIMIPKIFGVEVKKNVRRPSKGNRIYWNKDGFEKKLQELNEDSKLKVLNLLEFTQSENSLEGWGTGATPNFNFKINHPVRIGKKATVFTVWSDGYIQIGHWLGGVRQNALVDKFFVEVNKIDGISINQKQARTDRFPISNISIEGLRKLKGPVKYLKHQIDKIMGKI